MFRLFSLCRNFFSFLWKNASPSQIHWISSTVLWYRFASDIPIPRILVFLFFTSWKQKVTTYTQMVSCSWFDQTNWFFCDFELKPSCCLQILLPIPTQHPFHLFIFQSLITWCEDETCYNFIYMYIQRTYDFYISVGNTRARVISVLPHFITKLYHLLPDFIIITRPNRTTGITQYTNLRHFSHLHINFAKAANIRMIFPV